MDSIITPVSDRSMIVMKHTLLNLGMLANARYNPAEQWYTEIPKVWHDLFCGGKICPLTSIIEHITPLGVCKCILLQVDSSNLRRTSCTAHDWKHTITIDTSCKCTRVSLNWVHSCLQSSADCARKHCVRWQLEEYACDPTFLAHGVTQHTHTGAAPI